MSRLHFLHDPPGIQDHLRLRRYFLLLEEQLLRPANPPGAAFVTALYGPPGCGKSSLLRLLGTHLQQRPPVERWLVVEFSPWLAAPGQPLLPLLLARLHAALAGRQELAGLAAELSALCRELQAGPADAATQLGLMQRLGETLARIDASGFRLAFLLDGFDHYQDPAASAALLLQVRHWLRLDCSVWFIAAARERLTQVLQTRLGEAAAYLEHWVNLALELPPPNPLASVLPMDTDPELQVYYQRVAELFETAPERLKTLWNQALLGLALVRQELERAHGFRHQPSLPLMLKWLLIKDRGRLRANPYRYLGLESATGQLQHDTGARRADLQQRLLKELGLTPPETNGCLDWASDFERRLAVFLWHDLSRHRFDSPHVLSLYAHSGGSDGGRSRLHIEELSFAGQHLVEYQDFSWSKLNGGYFSGMRFIGCDFSYADLAHAELQNAVFERCQLRGARFDHARLDGCQWLACDGLDQLDSAVETYADIAESAAQCWERQRPSAWNPEPLYKMYRTILNRLPAASAEALRQHLLEKGKRVRRMILRHESLPS